MQKHSLRFRAFLLPLGLAVAVAVQPLAAQNNINVPANGSYVVNESGNYQNVTVGTGGSLTTIDANSGGGGDHAITVTFAAYGPGTIQNDGAIQFKGNDQGDKIVFANPITLSGSGTLSLANVYGYNDATIIGSGTLTQLAGHTLIGGGGNVGATGPVISVPLVNAGTVTTSSIGVVLNGASVRNTGTLSASSGATLTLSPSVLDNTGGLVAVTDAQSRVDFAASTTVIGGTLSSANSTGRNTDAGTFYNDGFITLQDITLAAGSVFVVVNPLTVAGTLTNNGYIRVAGFNYGSNVYADLNVTANATLAGSGVVQLNSGGQINATNNATLTVASGATLLGDKVFVDASVVNNGTVGSYYDHMTIDSPTFTNNGVLEVVGNSGDIVVVEVSGNTNLTNYDAASGTLTGGTWTVAATNTGATLALDGRDVKVNAATINLSGVRSDFGAARALTTNAGTLSLSNQSEHDTTVALTNTGAINLDAGCTLRIGGDFTGAAGSTLAVTVGGTQSQGAQSAGILQINGAATLGGNLVVTLAPGVQIAATDQIAIGSASSFGGSFANVIDGERVATADGSGTFQVNYGPGSAYAPGTLILSDFEQTGASIIPAFFSGEANLGSAYYLAFRNGNVFGYYAFLSDPHYLYHFDLGYEYVFDAADGQDGVYLYDFASQTFFYTSPVFAFPYLYDFSLNTVLYYYPDPNNPGRYNTNGTRYFYNFATGQIISK